MTQIRSERGPGSRRARSKKPGTMREAPKRRFAAQSSSITTKPRAYRELVYLYALERRKAECDDLFRAFARLVTFDDVLAFAWAQNDCEIWIQTRRFLFWEPSSPMTPPTASRGWRWRPTTD